MELQDVKFDGWPHIVDTRQFSRKWLEDCLFPLAREMKSVVAHGGCDILKRKRMVCLFYQPSTRTRASFEFAMDYLGGRTVFSTENAREFSSAQKGETLRDTILVLGRYRPDAIVLRYDREIGAEIAAEVSRVPILNAGDRNPGQHPTQGVLDVFTIQERLGRIDGLNIAIVGDLKGRVVRSDAYLFGKFKVGTIYFVSPACARMGDDVKQYLHKHDVRFVETNDLREVAPKVDVIIQTRTQKECGANFDRNDHDLGYFVVDEEITGLMQKDAIIAHPLPREDEIAVAVDQDPRAVYLTEQIDAGLCSRMALLKVTLAPNA